MEQGINGKNGNETKPISFFVVCFSFFVINFCHHDK